MATVQTKPFIKTLEWDWDVFNGMTREKATGLHIAIAESSLRQIVRSLAQFDSPLLGDALKLQILVKKFSEDNKALVAEYKAKRDARAAAIDTQADLNQPSSSGDSK